jgi:hypothetical protein
MATPPTTPTKKPPEVKPQPPTIKDFELWVTGRTGLTQDEFFNVWVSAYNLTPAQEGTLRAQVEKEPVSTPTPKPPVSPAPATPKQPTEKPELIIERTPYPKWWKDARAWNIDIDVAGTHTVIRQTPGWRSYISTIVLTVDGETNITFGMGAFGDSGSMDLGGTDEPRGMVVAMGNSPMPLGEGGFTITSTGAGVHVGGFISYFYEKE